MPNWLCEEPGCTVAASFNNPERVIARYCSAHCGPRMVNVRKRRCFYGDNCREVPTHADPRSPWATIACANHARLHMVQSSRKLRMDAWAAERAENPLKKSKAIQEESWSDITSDSEESVDSVESEDSVKSVKSVYSVYSVESDGCVELIDKNGDYVGF